MEKSIKISAERRKYIEDLDRSILHWSVQHTRLCMQADAARATVATLYQSHQKHIGEELQAAGVAPGDVVGARYDSDTGEVVVSLKDSPPSPEASPSAS